MANAKVAELAQLAGLRAVEKGDPWGGPCAAGMIEGFPPVAARWVKRDRQSGVAFLVRYRSSGCSLESEALREAASASPELLQALGKKKLSRGKRKALTVASNEVSFFWPASPSSRSDPRPRRRSAPW